MTGRAEAVAPPATVPRRWAPPPLRPVLAYVGLFAAIGAWAPYLALYYQSLGLPLPVVGALVSIGAGIGLVGAPAWGGLSDRLGGSPFVLAAATVLCLVSALALPAAGASPLLVVMAALMTFSLAGVGPIVDARALETTGRERAGYGPLRAWGSISYIASSWGTGIAIDAFGLPVLFVVLAGSMAFTGVVGFTLRPARPERVHAPIREGSRVLRRRPLALFLGGWLLAWVGLAAVSGFYSIRMLDLGAPVGLVGAASALGAAVEVPLMLAFPALASRFGLERLLVLGAAAFTVRAVVAAFSGEPLVLVALSGVNGIGFALFLVGGVTYVARHAPPSIAATVQGVFQGVGIGLAQMLGVGVGGVIAGGIGLAPMFLVAAALGGLAVVVVTAAVRQGGPRDGAAAGPATGAEAGPALPAA